MSLFSKINIDQLIIDETSSSAKIIKLQTV